MADKIINAMASAYEEVYGKFPTDDYYCLASDVVSSILEQSKLGNTLCVEEIQDQVENALMNSDYKDVARAYIIYRNKRTEAREHPLNKTIEDIIDNTDDYWSTENSNKDSKIITTQRDYMAGAISTDLMRRKILPKHLVEAHDNGIIHIHDMDYISMRMNNCCLINLEDMLQNGTVISKVKIDKPHKFSTACNIASQVVAGVASCQFGGQSITLSHLSPFVQVTRDTLKKQYPYLPSGEIEKMTKRDIVAGIQTLQYQVITLQTTNGQAPFVTVYMNLAEVPEGKERDDLSEVIREMLIQRKQGVKNEKGVYISPAFPKLIYALDECNIHENSHYFSITKLAAECSAKRLVPDYISNKIEKKLKSGDMFPSMG